MLCPAQASDRPARTATFSLSARRFENLHAEKTFLFRQWLQASDFNRRSMPHGACDLPDGHTTDRAQQRRKRGFTDVIRTAFGYGNQYRMNLRDRFRRTGRRAARHDRAAAGTWRRRCVAPSFRKEGRSRACHFLSVLFLNNYKKTGSIKGKNATDNQSSLVGNRPEGGGKNERGKRDALTFFKPDIRNSSFRLTAVCPVYGFGHPRKDDGCFRNIFSGRQ